MPDTSRGWIEIGGAIQAGQLAQICAEIEDAGLSLSAGEDTLSETEAYTAILTCAADGIPGERRTLFLESSDMSGGEPYQLMDLLRTLGVPFVNGCEAGESYGAAVMLWEPDPAQPGPIGRETSYSATDGGEPLIGLDEIERAIKANTLHELLARARRVRDRDIPSLIIVPAGNAPQKAEPGQAAAADNQPAQEFYMRSWSEQTLFDCRDYVVKAGTLEAAVLLLQDLQQQADQDGKAVSHNDISSMDPHHLDEIRSLDPREIITGSEGITLIDLGSNRVRDLIGVPAGCNQLGIPITDPGT